MRCPGCGASMTPEMVEQLSCGFCGTALPEDHAGRLADAVEKLASKPSVHVTKVEIRAPDLAVGRAVGSAFDGISARAFGCATSCVTLLFTVGILAVVGGSVAWQLLHTAQVTAPAAPRHGHR